MAYSDVPGMRFRHKTTEQRTASAGIETSRPAYPPDPPRYRLGTQRVFYENEFMRDVVVPRFHQLSREGAIFNNPMYTEHVKEDTPLATYQYSTGTNTNDITTYSFENRPWCPVLPKTLIDHEQLIDIAVTAAYANVSANEGNTLLWLGEFKETVAMLLGIGKSLERLIDMTKEQRRKWAKGQLTVEAQQSLTLAILYGILPLEESIAQFMDGLFKIKPPGRFTARGFQVETKTTSHVQETGIPLFPQTDVFERVNYSESIETIVRAGVLADVDFDGVPWISVIADPKSVISTAYALARLSFVIDWFINVGSTLAAWSPTAGIEELAAWVTVEQTVTYTGTASYVVPEAYSRTSSITGSGSFNLMKRVKYRSPISRADLAILPRVTLDLDLGKLSALVLLFAKVR